MGLASVGAMGFVELWGLVLGLQIELLYILYVCFVRLVSPIGASAFLLLVYAPHLLSVVANSVKGSCSPAPYIEFLPGV
jgi:hypothetical protein